MFDNEIVLIRILVTLQIWVSEKQQSGKSSSEKLRLQGRLHLKMKFSFINQPLFMPIEN